MRALRRMQATDYGDYVAQDLIGIRYRAILNRCSSSGPSSRRSSPTRERAWTRGRQAMQMRRRERETLQVNRAYASAGALCAASYDKEKGILGAGSANEEAHRRLAVERAFRSRLRYGNNVRLLPTTEISPFLPQRETSRQARVRYAIFSSSLRSRSHHAQESALREKERERANDIARA